MDTDKAGQGDPATRLVIESSSARATKAWGRRLASLLEGGELIALTGELGAGKTCFVKGLARGLSLPEDEILSPGFTLIQEHRGRLPLYHIDLYRLERARLEDLGLREYLSSTGVAAVEWFDRLDQDDEIACLAVRITYAGANSRTIELSALGDRYAPIIDKMRRYLG